MRKEIGFINHQTMVSKYLTVLIVLYRTHGFQPYSGLLVLNRTTTIQTWVWLMADQSGKEGWERWRWKREAEKREAMA